MHQQSASQHVRFYITYIEEKVTTFENFGQLNKSDSWACNTSVNGKKYKVLYFRQSFENYTYNPCYYFQTKNVCA